MSDIKPLVMAIQFHNAYERLAPSFGYETRKETREFDPNTPNGKLMQAVCAEVTQELTDMLDRQEAEIERLRADHARLLATAKVGGADVCVTCAAHVLVITQDLEPEIKRLRAFESAWTCFVSLQSGDVTKLCNAAIDNERLRAELEKSRVVIAALCEGLALGC